MTEWKTVKLGEVASRIGDGLHGTPKYDNNGDYYFVNGSNLVSGKIEVNSNTKRVSFEEYQKYKKELSNRTLLLGINGTIGNVAEYRNERCILGKSAAYINVGDNFDKKFIKYILLNGHFQKFIQTNASGTTIKNVGLALLREYEFEVPISLSTQKSIASILSSLDDKIELNRRMNETLEEMAMAVYRHYFINFGLPPGAKEEATECPFGKLIEHPEMGMIPEGWSVGKISDFAKSMQYGYTQSSTLEPIGPKFLRITDIQGGIVHWDNVPYCKINTNDYEKYKIIKGDIFIARTGASTGENTYIVSEVDAVFASYLIRLQFNDLKLARYIGQYLRTQDYFSYISGIIGGSAQPNASAPILAGALVLKPSDKVLNQFYSKMNKYDELKESNFKEIQSLTATRDYLLPRLLSGDVRVG